MSLVKSLGRWWRPENLLAPPQVRATRPAYAVHEPSELDAPRGGSIRALGLDELLEGHARLIDRICLAYGGEEGSFECHLTPSIRRYAAFVHLLPATRDAHFRYPGGLLRCGLEVGLHALQAADAQIFSAGGTVQARRAVAPRWRAAAFVTGLCSEAYRPVFAATVHCDIGGPWNPLLMPLLDWLERRRCDRYIVQWSEGCTAPRAATLAVLPKILAPTLLAFLAEPDRAILDHVICAIAAPSGVAQNAIGSIVEQTLARVLVRDLRFAPILHSVPAMAAASTTVSRAEAPLTGGADVTGSRGAASVATGSQSDVGVSPCDPPTAVEVAGLTEPAGDVNEQVPPVEAAATPPQVPQPVLAIPATLHPAIAEALTALLAPATGEPLTPGIDVSTKGVFVPLALFAQRGLDTGLVVGALHEARLLVLQGSRKVWRGHGRDPDAPGIMLNARLLA